MSATQTARPSILSPILDQIPHELRAVAQWVVWRLVEREGKWTKVPHNPQTGKPASSTDAATWASFAAAVTAYQDRRNRFDGVGYVFAAADPYFGVDLDHCRDPQTGELTPDAAGWIERFGTYAEVSPSGTGVKLIGLGALPEGMSGRRLASVGVECYDQGRYFTVTGHRIESAPATVEPSPEALAEFLAEFFPPPKPRPAPAPQPVAASPADLADDAALIARALAADNGAKFGALWNGNTAGYPGPSEADAALVSLLAFWGGNPPDPARIERLMRRSGLARDKWDSARGSETYLSYTIGKILPTVREFYTPGTVNPTLGHKSKKANSANPPYREREREGERYIYESPYMENSHNSQNSDFHPSDPWEGTPTPFDAFGDLPDFPVVVLPPALRAFVDALATHTGVALDLPGVQVLAALAGATQKRVAVLGKPGYTEPLILWGVSIAPPGSKKSAVLRPIRAPFERFEREENERRAPEVERSLSVERTARERLRLAESAVGKSKGNPKEEDRAELDSARHAIDDLRPVRPLALLIDDATPEAVAQILHENEGRAVFLDAEGSVFGHVTGRYSQRPALEVFLKGNGCEPYRFDRTGGKDGVKRSFSIPRPAVSMGIATQPQVLADLRENAAVVGRGFIQRCLFSIVPKVRAPFFSPEVPPEVSAAWGELVGELLRLSPSLHRGDDGEPEPYLVRLDPAASELYLGLYESIQDELEDESHGSTWAGWLEKAHGVCLRLAGVLHMATHGARGAELAIGAETMAGAVALTRYFHAHSRAALSAVKDDPTTEQAKRLLSWARRHRDRAAEGASEKDIRDHLRWSEPETQAALYLLSSRGYVRELRAPDREAGTRGRKPSPRWQFHPSLTWEVEA